MAEMPALRHLRLEGEYGAAPSKILPVLPHLETLEMLNAPTSLLRSLAIQPKLRELTLNRMSERVTTALLNCRSLRTLRLNRWAVLPEALEMLQGLAKHPSLQTIILEEGSPPSVLLKRIKLALPDCEIRVAALGQL